MSFLEELTKHNIINRDQADDVAAVAEQSGQTVDSILLNRGVDEDTLMEAKGGYLDMPVRKIGDQEISPELLGQIPLASARHYGFVPIGAGEQEKTLEVGILDPDNTEAMDALQFISTRLGTPFQVYLLSEKDFEKVLSQYPKQQAQEDVSEESPEVSLDFDPASTKTASEDDDQSTESENTTGQSLPGSAFQSDHSQQEDQEQDQKPDDTVQGVTGVGSFRQADIQFPGTEGGEQDEKAEEGEQKKQEPKSEDEEGLTHAEAEKNLKQELQAAAQGQAVGKTSDDGGQGAPVSKMVAVILRHATEGGASDIHIEHTGDQVRVRFRIDGDLHTSILLPKKVHAAMVSRVKILANLRLDEKRKPQDGRFSANVDERGVDFRVSTYPAYYGEKVVLRILDSERGVKTIQDLGLRDKDYEKLRQAIKAPYGIILLTGPTGSGKSTTLYSMLKELDREKDNVVSLEDPVEYHIQGVNQSNVKPSINYTFANGLRSILRQDPDVIMVGEIRDKETAQLAIQAALTGHLVLSTLHTNTSAGVIPRLVDMGVDPYLIAPTLTMAIGQRLVTRLCEGAEEAVPVDEAKRTMIEEEFSDLPEEHRSEITIPENVYEAGSTQECPSGTNGRQAVFEILAVNDEIKSTILSNPVENEVFKVARKNGMLTLKEDALLKAFDGKIPYTEVNTL